MKCPTEVGERNKKWLGKAKGNWVEELPWVLWSYRTTSRMNIKETPFSLTYGTEAMLPVDLEIVLPRTTYFKERSSDKDLRLSLDLIKDRVEQLNIRQVPQPKNQRKSLQDRRLRPKKEWGNPYPAIGKSSPMWEGPYKVIEVHCNGSYALVMMEGRPIPITWNARNLNKF